MDEQAAVPKRETERERGGKYEKEGESERAARRWIPAAAGAAAVHIEKCVSVCVCERARTHAGLFFDTETRLCAAAGQLC